MPTLPNTIEELGYKSADPLERASFAAAKEGYASPDAKELEGFMPNAVKSSVVNQSVATPSGVFVKADGSIDFQKSLDTAREKALQIQKQAQALQSQQNTGSNSFVSSSSPVVQQEKNTASDVSNLMASIAPPADGTESATTASAQYTGFLDSEIERLEKRRKEEEARINTQFDNAKVTLKDTQTRETGTTSAMLARAGGFLGGSGSGTGVLLTLAQNHKAEVGTLEAKRAEAIQTANSAITDKQFALAQLKVKEVKDLENTIHERKTQFFNDSLKAVQEARNQDEYYKTKIKDDLEMLGKLGASDEGLELDPEKAAEIDAYYGVPGFTKQYLEVISNSAKATAQKDALANQKNLLDLLEKIPSGETVTFPDGTTYTGLGSAGDLYTTLEVDDNGVGRMVAYDKRTGRINVTNVGAVGKAKSSSDGSDEEKALYEDNVTSTMQIQLEAEKMPDGTYDPDSYIRERKLAKEAFPELVSKLDAKFLNPSNGFFTVEAINQLRKKGIYAPTPSL